MGSIVSVIFSLLGDNGIITVSDLKNHCIRMVTSSGKFLDYIGSEVTNSLLLVLCTVAFELCQYIIILLFQFLVSYCM